jgi:hypothetical protein
MKSTDVQEESQALVQTIFLLLQISAFVVKSSEPRERAGNAL